MKQYNEHAVSPVVGVMLMLVVVIIIAAVVSGFAGGMAKGQAKAPQATIQGQFSVTQGLQIIHGGGDSLGSSDMVISIMNGPTFGPNMEAMSTSTLNMTTMTNAAGKTVGFFNPATGHMDGYNITSFNPGDIWYINITNCDPNLLQPTVAAHAGKGGFNSYGFDGTHWTADPPDAAFWALNFVNPANIGKTFYLDVNDKASGALISRAVVKITG